MMAWSSLYFSVITYLFIGSLAGLMAGILGLGGGLVVVPGLLYVFTKNAAISSGIAMHLAAGTSLAIMIFTSAAAVRAHHVQGDILWKIYRQFLPGLILGALLGAIIAGCLPSEWLQRICGVFFLFIAWRLLINIHGEHKGKKHQPWLNRLVGVGVGTFSGMLGVGGGTMVIPYLLHSGLSIRQAAPIAGLCSLTVAFTGALVFMAAGWHDPEQPAWSTGYIYWPAVLWVVIPAYLFTPVGVRLTYVLPSRHLKMIFIILVSITAVAMLF